MARKLNLVATLLGCAVFFFCHVQDVCATDDTPVTRDQFLLLQKQNEALQQQLQKQQEFIDALSRKVDGIKDSTPRADAQVIATNSQPSGDDLAAIGTTSSSFHFGKVDITGEGGVALFSSESQGLNPHPTFRIDEARVFLEAPVWNDVYFYSEWDLASRESTSLTLAVGELYLDFEDVSKLWGRDRMLNIRVGQFYTPFGEEYLNRFAIDNPLISHSVSDLWGSDAGIELYGKLGEVRYCLAIQNGGGLTSQALQDDKAVTGRVAYDPNKWLHASVSGMRTGNLKANNVVSAIWFGNSFFTPLPGSGATTYHANLLEGDIQVHLPQAQIKAAGGYIDYGDNDTTVNNHRNVFYYYIEGEHDFTREFYTAARFSEVLANHGFPIAGNGNMGTFGFQKLTSDYWRLSLALGYRFSRNLIVKGEYSFNQGQQENGPFRFGENAFALEAAFKF